MEQNGDTVAGRKVELIVKDDTGPRAGDDQAHRAGAGRAGQGERPGRLRPDAARARGRAGRHRGEDADDRDGRGDLDDPDHVAVHRAHRSRCRRSRRRSPTGRAKNKIKRVFTMVTDYGPGLDAEKTFQATFKAGGGEIVESVRTPLRNPDFAPFLQRAKDAKPDAVFVFVPVGRGPRGHEAVRRARPEAGGHPADRHRRRHRRRPAREHGRAGARRHHVVPLLGGARLAREQGLRRRAS